MSNDLGNILGDAGIFLGDCWEYLGVKLSQQFPDFSQKFQRSFYFIYLIIPLFYSNFFLGSLNFLKSG
ncbi:MAG: hypothetical protein IKW80_10120, partial [Thermoguttaceae bacterium]|nr:hypothetical protein [Thermoguttaceae bacterium]